MLFDAFWWVSGPTANRTVLRELVLRWRRDHPGDELIIAVPRREAAAARAEPAASGLRVVGSRLRPHALSNALELPRLARAVAADVVVVHNYTPATGSCPSVVFIHDLVFEDEPSWFSRVERLYFRPMALLARRATAVATSTSTEAARMERLHPELAPVHAIGLAVATELLAATPVRPPCVEESLPFALSVGRLNARKNLVAAVRGARASGRIRPSTPLLVVGSAEHSGAGTGVPPSIRALVLEGSVVFAGRVSDGELRWLYEHAAVTIYCSLDEGFGLPPIEAIAFGSSLVVSDRPVFHETVPGVAEFADPLDPSAIAAAVDRAWHSRRSGDADRGAGALDGGHCWSATVGRLRGLCEDAAKR